MHTPPPHSGPIPPPHYGTPAPPPGAPAPYPAPSRSRQRRTLLAGALLGVAALAGLGIVLLATSGPDTVLDGRTVEHGVRQILTDEYGLAAPAAVRCPDTIGVEPSIRSECAVTNRLGATKRVSILITSSNGDYLVGKPT